MAKLRNIFACLVHEQPECVIDLVRNLHALDPESLILLYNGGRGSDLLSPHFPFDRYGAVVHPAPRPLEWGSLHPFALDCIEWSLHHHSFDALTIVDSDQLAVRAGYSEKLAARLPGGHNFGLLGNSAAVQKPGTRISPAATALREIELWRPFLRQFRSGEDKFVHWCFWPSTVFLADAARELACLFRTSDSLRSIMSQTRIWATEEIILPTLVSLLGFDVGVSPFSYEYVQYRAVFHPQHIGWALQRDDVYWVHPVPRCYDHPVRAKIRERWKDYAAAASLDSAPAAQPAPPPLLLTLPILERMRRIEGWLEDAEADLLIGAATKALSAFPEAASVVEVGSYCGRSTVVLGSAVQASGAAARIFAVDPHDGVVGALDRGITHSTPTLEKFRRNIAAAGLEEIVEPVVKPSFEVEWDRPICLLFIDGLHDYANVSRDFYQFERWIPTGGFVAFHDYAHYYPGVQTFVDELLATGKYCRVHLAASLMLLRKEARVEIPVAAAPVERRSAPVTAPAPAILTSDPLVSCIMPTADRRAFAVQAIRYFERQDYANRELIVIDDGASSIEDVVQSDRVRYIRLNRRRSMGDKHNLACEAARGEIILHWDDDDWMAPWRISYQAEQLRPQPAETLSGLSQLMFWDPRAASAWEYIYPPADRPWVAGGTFCYRRRFWEQRRFPDMNEGADTVFVWGLRNARVQALSNHAFYVAVIHVRNTSPKRTNTFGWRPLAVNTIENLLGGDLEFYGALAC